VGPTNHGLAATAMLVMVMPFALVRILHPSSRRSWWLNGAAFVLMVAGAMSTDRKTALLVPVALVIYIGCYRPREMLRLAPAGLLILVAVVHFASPHALGTILNFERNASSKSTEHRASDFGNLAPDIKTHPLIGRGFGTLSYEEPSQFRVNDDEYLDQVWEVGAIGLLAFLWMILAPVFLARKAIRSREPPAAALALAGSAACVAFLVACALFDALGFPQAPYMFFIVAALTTIASAGPAGNVVPLRELVRRRRVAAPVPAPAAARVSSQPA
jgi:polysaccharide biosynthesis protein PslJ